jgi:DNA invertase Pin-like site-specific DNA recombinase
MIACYCRISSARQKTDSQTPEIRRRLQGNWIVLSTVQWFEDKETGRTLERPASDRLQKAIFAGRIKTVVVWKRDRISCRQRDGVNLLADWCGRGVRVVAVAQQIDPSGAVGRMVASILFGLAEIESEHRRERQAAGIAVAKERGVYRGRLPGTTKAARLRARQLRSRGLTVQEIAKVPDVSRRTAFRYPAESNQGLDPNLRNAHRSSTARRSSSRKAGSCLFLTVRQLTPSRRAASVQFSPDPLQARA